MSLEKFIIGSIVKAALDEQESIKPEDAEAALRAGAARLDAPRPALAPGDLVEHDGAIYRPFPFGFGLFRRWLDEPLWPKPTSAEDFGSAHSLEPHDCVVARIDPNGSVIEFLMPSRRLRPYVRPEKPAAEPQPPAADAA